MASIKDLKKRIGSVKTTQQTTKAMKMVSAAKLRRAQDAINNHRPYSKRIGELIRLVAAISGGEFESPLIRSGSNDSGEAAVVGRRVLLVLVSSDRGLCGGFNGNVIKAAQRWIASDGTSCEYFELAFVGKRGNDFFKTRKYPIAFFDPGHSGKVAFLKARKVTGIILERFLSGQVNEVKFIYNEFKNAISQQVLTENFLPLEPLQHIELLGAPAGVSKGTANQPETETPVYIVKPDTKALMESMLSKHFATQVFRMMLESQAGEHGARMSAMENATKNAGEMIQKLTLQYNKQRQTGITKELLEIIAGSESQKNV
ncbi:ATP synthase F1 subunit gamma [Bdellovibrionota bacterium FG-2]